MNRLRKFLSIALASALVSSQLLSCAGADRRDDAAGPDRLQRLEVKRIGPDYLVRIEGTQKPTYTVFRLLNPTRVVVDLANYDVRGLKAPRTIERGEVSRIRARQFGDEQLGIGRFELTLRTLADFEAWADENAVVLRIQPAQAKIDKVQALTQTDDATLLEEPIEGEDTLLEEEFIEDIPLEGDAELPPLEEEVAPAPVPAEDALPPLEEPAPAAEDVDSVGEPELPPLEEPAPAPAVAEPELPPLEEPAPAPAVAEPELPPLEEPAPAPAVAEPELPPLEEPAPAPAVAEPELPPLEEPAPTPAVAEPELPPLEEPAPAPAVAEPELPPLEEASERDRLAAETLQGYEEPLEPVAPQVLQAEQLVDLVWDERGGETTVRIIGNGPIGDYNVQKLEAPARIAIDLWNVSSLIPGEEFPVGTSQVQKIRVANHPDKVRVVIDLIGIAALNYEASKDGDALAVRVLGAPILDNQLAPQAIAEPEPVIEVATPAPAPARAAQPVREEVEPLPVAPKKPTIGPGNFELKVAEAPKPKAAEQPKKKYTGRKISLDFKDADIDSVLRLIAEVSELNIVTDEEVKGTISIRLVNVPWDQALDVILSAKQLGIRKMGNIVRVAPMDKLLSEDEKLLQAAAGQEDLLPLFIRVVPVNYASAGEISARLSPILSKRGKVDVDARTNVLIIKDIERVIEDAVALVRSLDAATPQVLIEAKIVEANTTFTRDLGVQWGGGYRNAPEFGNSALPGRFGVAGGSAGNTGFQSGEPNFAVDLPAAVGTGSGGALGFMFGSLNNSVVLDLRLSALESSGEGRIISSPRITTLDNEKAQIEQGVAIPYSTVSAQGTQTQFINAVLRLEVTPHITPDRSILLDLRIQKNAPDDTFRSGDGSPAISKKEAASRMLVADGETAVVGGIYTVDRGSSRSGVPFLSKIPILGWFFKKNTQRDTKTEMLLFVTPRIIQK